MIPLFIPAITLAGVAVLTKYTSDSRSDSNKPKFRLKPMRMEPGKTFTLHNPVRSIIDTFASRPNPFKNLVNGGLNRSNPFGNLTRRPANLPNPIRNLFSADGQNPFRNLFSTLSSTVSGLTKKPQEDYNKVLKGFIPEDAYLLTPQYPPDSQNFRLADIDGDSRSELLATYRQNDEIKTLILKKQGETWGVADEILHPQHDNLHYRGIADITGQGRKQLLFGMTSEGKPASLYGYTYEDNKSKQLFTQEYDQFEIVRHSRSPKACFAVWNRKDADSYDINVLQWDGTKLEPVPNSSGYYLRNVAAYYANKVKKNPRSAAGWYNLADALIKAGEYKDALTAIEEGNRSDRNMLYADKFADLKNSISKG